MVSWTVSDAEQITKHLKLSHIGIILKTEYTRVTVNQISLQVHKILSV